MAAILPRPHWVMSDKGLFILHDPHPGCWWHGDARCQGLNSYGIHLILLEYFHGLVQDCCNSIANALELQQSCNEPLIWVVSAQTGMAHKMCAKFHFVFCFFISNQFSPIITYLSNILTLKTETTKLSTYQTYAGFSKSDSKFSEQNSIKSSCEVLLVALLVNQPKWENVVSRGQLSTAIDQQLPTAGMPQWGWNKMADISQKSFWNRCISKGVTSFLH